MTGFGRGVARAGDLQVTVEVRAVNHRFLDVKVRGTAAPVLEELAVGRVRERLERGAVTVVIAVDRGGPAAAGIDRAAARRVYTELAELARELALPPPHLAEVLRVPGVIAAHVVDGDAAAAPVGQALAAALEQLCAHREREGQALAADLAARVDGLRALVAELTTEAAAAAPAIAARLRDRLAEALAPGAVAPDRLAQEVAILVERADVTEELVRARAHLDALAATLVATGAVGRRLDFLLQELGREINTTGAKSATAAISARVVQAKAELEKMREQVQNLE
jgi:uncharacterized protein (TIGR00255 family)